MIGSVLERFERKTMGKRMKTDETYRVLAPPRGLKRRKECSAGMRLSDSPWMKSVEHETLAIILDCSGFKARFTSV